MTKIFVYGTLKKGFSNHNRFLSDQKFLGEAKTLPNYKLYRTTSFPCMVRTKDNEGVAVKGELWEIDEDCLQRLDWFEGHPDLFERQLIAVENQSDIFAYVFNQDVKNCNEIGDSWNVGKRV